MSDNGIVWQMKEAAVVADRTNRHGMICRKKKYKQVAKNEEAVSLKNHIYSLNINLPLT